MSLLLVLSFCLPASAALAAGPWQIVWSSKLEDHGLHVRSVSPEGAVYLRSAGWMLAFNADGSRRWRTDLSQTPKDVAIGPDGTTYLIEFAGMKNEPLPPSSGLGCDRGPIAKANVKLSAYQGKKLWELTFKDDELQPLQVCAWKLGVYCLRGCTLSSISASGKLRWETDKPYTVFDPQIAIASDGRVFRSSWAMACYVTDSLGKPGWDFTDIPEGPGQLPYWFVMAPGNLAYYFIPDRGVISAINTERGTLRWDSSRDWLIAGHSGHWPGREQPEYDPYLDKPIIVDYGHTITETTRRNLQGPPPVAPFAAGPPAVAADGRVFLADAGRKLFALDRDGNKLWSFRTEGRKELLRGWAVISPDGLLYVGSTKGLLCLDQSGKQLGRDERFSQLECTPYFATDGLVYLINAGTLYALKP